MSNRLHRLLLIFLATLLLAACTDSSQASLTTPPPTLTAPATTIQPAATPEPTPTPTSTPVPLEPPEGYFWWNQKVFYEIFMRSFYDSDGDGIGDFNGLTSKLDYLNDGDPTTSEDLGVTGLWLMPIFPTTTYHGYDVIDYMAVNPEYGTLEDFQRFLDAAHQRGIRVILDLPLNHTSSQHPWFQGSLTPDSPYRDYYVWSESDPVRLGPWGQDAWHEGPQGGFYYGVFWSEMPDLNYANPAVVEEMDQVARFWLDLGVDGFRLDGARYIVEEGEKQADSPATHAYYQHLREVVKGVNPEALLLGEVWTDNFTASTYVKQGDELDLVFDFELAKGIVTSAKSGRSDKVDSALKFNERLLSPGKSAPFLTNHDQDRLMSELEGEQEKAKNAAAMLLSGPGVPFLYYGEEVGMAGRRAGRDTDDIQRRLPMQWSAGENAGFTSGASWTRLWPFYKATNVEFQTADPDSLLSFYRDWIRLRGQHPALMYGQTYVIETNNPAVFAVLRSVEGEGVLALVNLSAEPIQDVELKLRSGPLAGAYALEPIYGAGSFAELSANAQGGFDAYFPLAELPAFSRLLLQLQPLK
jgi:glycosidase